MKKLSLYEIIIDYNGEHKTAYKASFSGRAIEWSQIFGMGGYSEIDSSEVPIKVKNYVKEIRKIKIK